MDQQTPNTPQSKLPSSDGIDFCNKYFRDNPPSSWTYRSFLSHYSTLVPPLRLDIVNSRYLKALEKIEDSPEESADRKKKARSLIDKHRNAVSSLSSFPKLSALLPPQVHRARLPPHWTQVLNRMPGPVQWLGYLLAC